jgi:uncharacterized protein YecE (DUF72 family)
MPPGRRTLRGFDELRFYAEHFDTVEINSTFYRVPLVATAKQWAARTPPGFEFSLKLFQKFTHPEMFYKSASSRASRGSEEPEDDDLRKIAHPLDVDQKDVDGFRAAIDPLAEKGKLGALLAQFPASFRNAADTRGYLEWLLERFQGYMVAVELRHSSWSDAAAETFQLLDAFDAAWTQIDEPKFRTSIRQKLTPPSRQPVRASDQKGAANAKSFYYLRLHGRNAKQWWSHDKSEDRYNYLYSTEELRPFADAVKTASREVKKAYLYANNHFSAKSVANAAILKHEVGQPVPGEYPQEFVDRYPDLRGIVKVLPSPLLPSPS